MHVSLTIIRYPVVFMPLAIFAMAFHRVALWFKQDVRFFKLMGCGKNGTFDIKPDWRQWAILVIRDSDQGIDTTNHQTLLRSLYGRFIQTWYQFFRCETFTVMLTPIEGHGTWDGKHVFGKLPPKTDYEGMIAVLTRATIRINKLGYFWKNVAPVASKMAESTGFITSVGIGEIPWIKQATFSIWASKEHMKAFAYGMKEHAEVIRKTRKENWYSEDMFTRFIVTGTYGTIRGLNPLQENMYI